MVVPQQAAPPTPGSWNRVEPTIDPSAQVHAFSNLIGDVRVGAGALVAPGTSIRADEGFPFFIGDRANLKGGVMIHGFEAGRVTGGDGKLYSVWIGQDTCITHMALVHGPAYVGDRCFIGFRSTVFNARIGDDCIIMAHALVQDVAIPAGKYVPSGAIVTTQEQADRLPDALDSDRGFANHVVRVNAALITPTSPPISTAPPPAPGDHSNPPAPPPAPSDRSAPPASSSESSYSPLETMSANSEVQEQIRSLLSQGHHITVERANKRRYKTSSWLSAGRLQASTADRAIAELEATIAQSPDEYVRIIGVDVSAKRRVQEVIVHRPGEPTSIPGGSVSIAPRATGSTSPTPISGDDVHSQIQSLVRGGYKISLEHADSRRFKTSSWLTGPTVSASRERAVFSEIEAFCGQHAGEYVRVIGVDTQAKRRALELIVQRPDGKTPIAGRPSYGSVGAGLVSFGSGRLSPEAIEQVRSLLAQDYKVGTEHADPRRFKTGSWQTCSPITATQERDVIAALEACMSDHSGEYVRLLGIDTKAKRRVLETIIQRPDGGNASTSASPTVSAVRSSGVSASSGITSSSIDSKTQSDIDSLLNQGFKIGLEHASKRRFKTGSWQTVSAITGSSLREVLSAVDSILKQHSGDYVRVIGIDPKAKRRVLETIIQRP